MIYEYASDGKPNAHYESEFSQELDKNSLKDPQNKQKSSERLDSRNSQRSDTQTGYIRDSNILQTERKNQTTVYSVEENGKEIDSRDKGLFTYPVQGAAPLQVVPTENDLLESLQAKLSSFENQLKAQQGHIESLQSEVHTKDEKIQSLTHQLGNVPIQSTPISTNKSKKLPPFVKQEDIDFWKISKDPEEDYANLRLQDIASKNDLWIFALEKQAPFQATPRRTGIKSNALTRGSHSRNNSSSSKFVPKRGSLDPLTKKRR